MALFWLEENKCGRFYLRNNKINAADRYAPADFSVILSIKLKDERYAAK
uniref:Uncharacterized protein n=1 Tax=uncultured Desulfobacterium sp. TaxID=201089 RepID=E1YBZ9_9BACT|nr:unknown protein [uncultured Desulfobacterium sp.]